MISHAFSTFHEHGKNFAVLYYLVSIRCLDQGGERFLVESDRSRFIGPWTAPSIAFQILGIEQSFELDFQSRKKYQFWYFGWCLIYKWCQVSWRFWTPRSHWNHTWISEMIVRSRSKQNQRFIRRWYPICPMLPPFLPGQLPRCLGTNCSRDSHNSQKSDCTAVYQYYIIYF